MVTTEPWIEPDELHAFTGWHLRPEGLCQGDRCIPLPAGATNDSGRISVAVLADRGFAVEHDEARSLWAVGPQAGPTLAASELAPLTLVDLDGAPVDVPGMLGPDRGVLLAFASW